MSDLPTREVIEMAGKAVALEFHLTSRLYPPPHPDFYPAIEYAIERAREGKWGEVITLPNGLSMTVGEIVEKLHLDAFVEEEEEDA